MAIAIGPLTGALDEIDTKFDAADLNLDEATDGEKRQIREARKAVKALAKSGVAGDGPFEVSLAVHELPEEREASDQPYVSLSVVGAPVEANREPAEDEAPG